MNLRRATVEDFDDLYISLQGIVEAERPFDDTLKPGQLTYYDLKALCQREDAVVAVIVIDGKIVATGSADIRFNEPYRKYKTFVHLGFMYVDPKYRGQGLNKLIVDYLTEWSIEKGEKELKLTVYPDNASAVQAYIKTGFKPFLLEMYKSLE